MVVIDASVWASSLLQHDSNYHAARNWIGSHIANGGSFVAPLLLVIEISATISRVTQDAKSGRAAASHLYSFPHMRLVPMDQILVDEAVDLAAQFHLRGADALYVAVAKELSIPLVTFDAEQLARPAAIITTISP
jgi:predicted nucleic acid-binding protein